MIEKPAVFIREQTEIASPSAVPELKLHLAGEVTPLWKMTEERLRQADLPPPFWAFAWPGGQGVARYILENPEVVKGKRVLDFAAGSGVAAIAAMKAGAKSALAVDIDELALHAIEMNAAENGVEVQTSDGVDMTKPFSKVDVILAGDVCYQQAMSAKLMRWLRLCVDKGILAIMADPGRAYVPHDGMITLASYDVPTSRDLEDCDMRTVTVWRLENIAQEED